MISGEIWLGSMEVVESNARLALQPYYLVASNLSSQSRPNRRGYAAPTIPTGHSSTIVHRSAMCRDEGPKLVALGEAKLHRPMLIFARKLWKIQYNPLPGGQIPRRVPTSSLARAFSETALLDVEYSQMNMKIKPSLDYR